MMSDKDITELEEMLYRWWSVKPWLEVMEWEEIFWCYLQTCVLGSCPLHAYMKPTGS